ncbi:MAG: hypothetical protein FWC73_06660 [Defluviitaleaceae bacterium]|nr:hypothetical protein [Defluviitaleaceae bacterium]
MKRSFVKYLVVVALLSLFAVIATGCRSDDGPAEGERVTVVMSINQENGACDTDTDWKFDMVEYMEDLLNINLVLRSQNMDQDTLMVAAGDIPDIFQAHIDFMPMLILGEHITPLDDLVEAYAPDIAADTARLDFLRRFQSEGTGQLWGITNFRGSGGHGHSPGIGHFVRWDLYSQLGYPEMHSPDDIIDLLYQMVQLEPVNEHGAPNFGLGAFVDWGTWAFTVYGAVSDYAGTTLSSTLHIRHDGTHIHDLIDIDGGSWSNLRHFNRADQLGIFDRDSLVQTADEYYNKAGMGQYMSINASWWISTFNNRQRELDPYTITGHAFLPFDGMWVYGNSQHPFGHFDNSFTIGANSDVQGAAMRLINYLNSYDGIRQLMSGTMDTTLEMVDGRPEIRSYLIDPPIGEFPLDPILWRNSNVMGIAPTTLHPVDGQPLSLHLTPRAFALQNSHLDTMHSAHFGVEFPFGIVQRFIAEGRASDFSVWNSPLVGALETPPMDIQRIDTLLDDILWRYMPLAILAESDEAFEAVFESAVAEFMAAGHQESVDWWTQAYYDAYAIVGEFTR